jgi:hypothetical protein
MTNMKPETWNWKIPHVGPYDAPPFTTQVIKMTLNTPAR